MNRRDARRLAAFGLRPSIHVAQRVGSGEGTGGFAISANITRADFGQMHNTRRARSRLRSSCRA